ncbi:TonB-dependent receptor domain-containing protein [Ancylomarina sp.]|uniref:TonB-dependent receptor domain-containing protein n=1 Tax=Ancylomarina sp. TaxID=1970196 RepID=UPI003565893F
MKNIIILYSLIISMQAYAQKTIRLQDKTTGHSISNAHFLYHNQKGISSEEGLISIQPIADATLLISHVNYGKIEIDNKAVLSALKSGVLNLSESYISLMPATVIARSNGKGDSHMVKVNNSDKLSHDAGDFLSQNAFIGGIRKSGAYGFDPVMRGFKYDQLNIVMDNGLSATAACPNRMDPPASQIPLAMVDQVEIIRGPHSLRFGNAFGGTIHFKSSPVTFTDTTKLYGRASGSYESNGNIKRTEALAGIKGEFFNINLLAAYNEGDDYEDGDGNTIPSGFNRRNIGLSSVFKLSSQQSLKLAANNNYAENVDFPALNMDLREDDTWLMNLQHKINFKNSSLSFLSTSFYGSFVDHTMDNLGKELNPRMVNAITKAKTKNYGARSEASFEFKKSSLFTGIDFKSEEAEGNRSREMLMGPMTGNTIWDNIWQDSRIRKFGLFAESHFSWDEVYFVASTRLEFNQAESRDKAIKFVNTNKEDPSDKLNISFSVGASHDISKEVRMGLWLGRAERSGSLTERFINYLPVDRDPYERIGNTKLKSEVNYQLDYNFTWKREDSELSVNLFTSYLRDYVSSEIRTDLTPLMATAPGVKQYVNIDKAIMRGFELSWYQKICPMVYHKANVAYTYGKNQDKNQALAEIPPLDLRYALGGHFFKEKFHPEFMMRHVIKQNRVSSDFGETVSPAFSLLDFKAAYSFNDKTQLIAGVRNVFDEAYYEHLNRSVKGSQQAIYAPGRSFYLTFAVGLF